MKKLLLSSITLCAALGFQTSPLVFADEQSNNNPSALKNPNKDPAYPYCEYHQLVFSSATDTFTYNIAKTEGTAAGVLRVRTLDCCIAGDEWTATLNGIVPANKQAVGTSNGNTVLFNGDAALAPANETELVISYFQGVDSFAAGMDVEICYSRVTKSGGAPITVTPVVP